MVTKFNQDLCNDLCELHSQGLPKERCAYIVGINRKTLYRWLKKGENAKSGKYRQFYLQWMKSEAEYELMHLGHINESTSWLAHQYMLQVMDPERYVVAEKQEMETTVKADANINADVDLTSDDFMNKELELMKTLIEDKHND
jgi:hypothetical protein